MSFCSHPEIRRSFRVGDEISTHIELDKAYVSKLGPFFVMVPGSESEVEEPKGPVALENMSVKELRDKAADLGYPDLPQNMRKLDLVEFLTGLTGPS
jgi:hypothetical protein